MWVIQARKRRAAHGWLRYYGTLTERGHVEVVGRLASATPSHSPPVGEAWAWLAERALAQGYEISLVELAPRGGTEGEAA